MLTVSTGQALVCIFAVSDGGDLEYFLSRHCTWRRGRTRKIPGGAKWRSAPPHWVAQRHFSACEMPRNADKCKRLVTVPTTRLSRTLKTASQRILFGDGVGQIFDTPRADNANVPQKKRYKREKSFRRLFLILLVHSLFFPPSK